MVHRHKLIIPRPLLEGHFIKSHNDAKAVTGRLYQIFMCRTSLGLLVKVRKKELDV